jgi:hypothetical protein
VGACSTASAATSVSTHVQRSVVSVKADDYRWDNGVGYLRNVEEGYCWDGNRGWHYCWTGYRGRGHGDRFTDAARYVQPRLKPVRLWLWRVNPERGQG